MNSFIVEGIPNFPSFILFPIIYIVNIIAINFNFSQGALNLEISDRIGIVYDFLYVDLFIAVGDVFEVVDKLEKIILVRVNQIVDLLLEAVDDTQGDEDNRKLFFAYDIIKEGFDEFQGKRVEKEAHKPLENPDLIWYSGTFYFICSFGHFLFEQIPKDRAVEPIQGEFVLVEAN